MHNLTSKECSLILLHGILNTSRSRVKESTIQLMTKILELNKWFLFQLDSSFYMAKLRQAILMVLCWIQPIEYLAWMLEIYLIWLILSISSGRQWNKMIIWMWNVFIALLISEVNALQTTILMENNISQMFVMHCSQLRAQSASLDGWFPHFSI